VLLRLRCISRLPSGDWPWFRLLHAYLLYCLEISNAITKDIDDLNILNVQNGIPDVTEVLVKVTKAFIRLLNGFKGLLWQATRISLGNFQETEHRGGSMTGP
jgi:hypothetical protein